jgi:hypothetical protein
MNKSYKKGLLQLGLSLLLMSHALPTSAQLKPVILVPPLGLAVASGGSALFLVEALSFTTMSYQWRFNGINIPGATSSIYVRTNISSAHAGNYTVRIQNAGGAITSAPVALVVLLDTVTNIVSKVVTPLTRGMTSNGFNVVFNGPAGSNFVIQASSDAVNWTSISTNAAPNGTVDFTDPAALNHPFRFYRAYVP